MARAYSATVAAVAAWTLVMATAPAARSDGPYEAGVDLLFLVKDCAAAGHTLYVDCAESFGNNLETMLWGVRNPTAASPIVVDIGPGTFSGRLDCTDNGHVTFRGMGRDRTFLSDVGTESGIPITININNCDGLEFQDLTVIADTPGTIAIPVFWAGGGSSTWTDVDLVGIYAGWDESVTVPCGDPVHYFFGSRIISSGSYGYRAVCGEHWFYGSEVRTEAQALGGINPPRHGVLAKGEADIRLFGSTVRSHAGAGYTASSDYVGVGVETGGAFHMHGGIISVSAAPDGNDAIGISVESGSSAHTLDTAFALTKGTGQAIRVQGDGDVRSPLLWESGTDTPAGGGLVSKTGKDLFVETDCDSDGDCEGIGTEPHLMIYSEACGADPWFDSTTGRCRNDTGS